MCEAKSTLMHDNKFVCDVDNLTLRCMKNNLSGYRRFPLEMYVFTIFIRKISCPMFGTSFSSVYALT